jgi:VanZ family protein
MRERVSSDMRGWRGDMQISILRVCAGCSILALAVLSWLPAHDMVRTQVLLPSEEHFLAYLLSGLLVAAAMPRYRFILVACFYVLLATTLELGQNFVPGRDPEAFTAFVSMCGAIFGEVVARLISGTWRERFALPWLRPPAQRGEPFFRPGLPW